MGRTIGDVHAIMLFLQDMQLNDQDRKTPRRLIR